MVATSTGGRAMSDKYAHVRSLETEVASLLAAAHRQWWRPRLNRRRRTEARRLLAQAGHELDLIEQRSRDFREARERLGHAGTGI
jgi:hypothetical protein